MILAHGLLISMSDEEPNLLVHSNPSSPFLPPLPMSTLVCSAPPSIFHAL
jgi:hypothetical protein